MDAYLISRTIRAFRGTVIGGAALVLGLTVSLSRVQAQQFLGTDFLTGNASGATVNGVNAHAVGATASANGDASLAVGFSAQATGVDTTAVGNDASALNLRATAVGRQAGALGLDSSAFGSFAQAAATDASAFGSQASAQGNFASAFGFNSNASGEGGSAFGTDSQALGTESSAFGTRATATATASSALGRGASAAFVGSTAIGADATTTRVNQMAFGTATNTYTAAGITSAASKAAQTGDTQVVTSDAAGNLATTDSDAFITNNSAFQDLQSDVRDSTEGVAMALAMAGSAAVLPDNRVLAVSANWGTFEGRGAAAIGGVARLQGDLFMNAGVGFSSNTTGGRAGVTYAW